ncbi:methyltransferase [Cupriavidus pauculus]|uniref:methyltransferase n=1 Tax=Cupriavidus pauculus TaxID=82633 RepID=UPI001245ED3D|nr:class I SAM-dependent methyltransferase [Cupriavidus pauculus]KAB0604323.1 class I SAM-dependent methyltransferase [Cupriavidus pauculus]MCM3606548.1 class I SAM-dependent methyltransferase [Cupriavidus pauculus]UAL00634.1 class I SAM-dependent methyltransferase [Cupriavidus pauculus]
MTDSLPTIEWTEDGAERSALWRSEAGLPPPKRVVIADDQTPADTAYRLASEGTALLWRGDFQNARQLLQAMARRVDRKPQRKSRNADKAPASLTEAFHKHRLAQSQRARTLGMLLLPFEAGHVVPLRRAPDVREACEQVYGPSSQPYVASMRELLGLIGAYEWRRKGVEIPILGERIHPWYGVFSPVRGEYLELVAREMLPSTALAFDIGTGTGILAALLAERGVERVIGTDQDARALGCARENIARLGLDDRVEIIEADLFPQGRAPLIVCNPPWVPARPASPIEHAVFDPDSRMLRGFLDGLAAHLEPRGQGWLILSDFAEHLGLRTRDQLLGWIDAAGLKVLGRSDVRPHHPKANDAEDPLFAARKAEVTSLWRLAAK